MRLALFALAVQLGATFGHVHLDNLALASTQATQAVVVDHGSELPNKSDSKDQTPHGDADSDCPICALLQLANSSPPSLAPVLPVPTAFHAANLEAVEARDFTAPRAFAFQARAPPTL